MRTLKELFFKVLFTFKTISYPNAIKLTQQIYNSREHAGIYHHRPIDVHFNSHISSLVARKNVQKLNLKQRRLKSIFSLHPSRQFKIGEQVLVKKKRTAFYKPNSVFDPQFQTTPTVITATNEKYLPFTFQVASMPGRWLYSFELKKVGRYYGNLENQASFQGEKIQVLDFTFESSAVTRSGLKFGNRNTVYYRVKRGNNVEKIDADTLRFFKRVLGAQALEYSEVFLKPENKHLVL